MSKRLPRHGCHTSLHICIESRAATGDGRASGQTARLRSFRLVHRRDAIPCGLARQSSAISHAGGSDILFGGTLDTLLGVDAVELIEMSI